MSSAPADLNQRQLKFVLVYVRTGNASEAAREAGYSRKTADVQGARLLRNARVAAEVAKFQSREVAKFERRAEVSYQSLLQGLAATATAQMADFASLWEGDDPVAALKALGGKSAPIGSFTLRWQNERWVPVVRLWNRVDAEARLLDEIRKGPPRRDESGAPAIELDDLNQAELAQFRACMDMLAEVQRRRDQRAKQIELDRSQYEEADPKNQD